MPTNLTYEVPGSQVHLQAAEMSIVPVLLVLRVRCLEDAHHLLAREVHADKDHHLLAREVHADEDLFQGVGMRSDRGESRIPLCDDKFRS